MRAFTFAGPSAPARLTEIATPEPGPGEVRIRVGANTVCGTDLRILRGEKTKGVDLGVVLGHEVSGHVDAVGDGVRNFEIGDLVAMPPSLICGLCGPCRRGYEHLCERVHLVGYDVNGGLADYMLMPRVAVAKGLLMKAPATLEPAQLSLAEPLSCCLNGLDNYRVEVGDTVVILGAGPIGMIHLQLARLAGAAKVIISEPHAGRRGRAAASGADVIVDPATQDLLEVVRDETGGAGADVAVLCIGLPELVNECLSMVRKRGRVSIFAGLAGEGWSNIAANLIHYRELTVVGASNSGRESFARAIRLLSSGAIDTGSLLTHTFGLSRAAEAIEFVATREGLKVAVVPD
ncbi:alcohol dehydrogenase catalytic domain-containing protein [Micropruina sp.]|uniref:alcohol dehydrogenase catalytic domain-containing protein n=1 Tax=Micropruina sp. TaxID=2737536 RepID=UPI002637F048|nr:alcohol dehydrogenase catalytic domain-containing protein [Micropruina sp.]